MAVFRILAVPVVAPMVRVVAAWAKLTVVAVVLTKANVVEPVVKEVVIAGEVPNTATPLPVSSVRASSKAADKAVAAKLEDASVNMALDAVRSGRLITDDPESITMFPVVVPPIVRVFKAVV